ncbi:transcriptional regulator [Pseudonocardia sulfidoxydans NBRC 16205]|uniref:Transcriptional regulator n=1 Tax=Pseudonocardia sulfidoxydans NBRC 16205 TaxID=1223511 RepID=A0A511DL74_9PSEU|nr:ATP-binding protein [Pseudonocardia sulfidoxydans]GEL25559.1 transcriptional regulator [Pseudonocardia sulfidoxydans NBRC 16205]
MDPDDLAGLLHTLRRFGSEPSNVEVKSGAGGFPSSLRETLVAFANTDGGVIVVGVDEAAGFAVVDLPEVGQYRDQLVAMSSTAVTPPLRIETEFVQVEGARVLLAVVPALPADQRPAYVTSKGVSTGAYIRTGDGDRRMSEAEIGLTYASRTQPVYDRERVEGAVLDDLDRASVARTLERVRVGSAYLRDVDDATALHRLGALSGPESSASPTLAGILTFGRFPQQFFPQLMASVVVHPHDADSVDTRFVDNVTLRGSIPEIVAECLATLRRNLSARALNVAGGRTDRLDFPLAAIREAVVNALMHRDYSPITRGTQVQIELLPDRLVIRSPGGLYGPISEEDLGEIDVSSSRNAALAQLLSDTHLPRSEQLVAENRASGIPLMIAQARTHGLRPPTFESRVTHFTVAMGRSELLGPDVRAWLASLHTPLPTSAHEIAVAMMRGGGFVTNATLREWGVERHVAGAVLRNLTEAGVAIRQGGRRYARYVLDPDIRQQDTPRASPETDMASMLQARRIATAAELATATGLSRSAVLKNLNALISAGAVQALGAARSPKRTYEWIGRPQ